jgi:hypothetical protein
LTHEQVKVEFLLEPDEDGYPPVSVERLWATPLPNGHYVVDNIPFFVAGISAGDEIAVDAIDGVLRFGILVCPSGISTFRVIPSDSDRVDVVRRELEGLGGNCEIHRQSGLIAIEVGADVPIQPFPDYFVREKAIGAIDFEEAALRHSLP